GYADSLHNLWINPQLETHPLQEFPDLSIDWIWAKPPRPEYLIIISIGEHGIEGYVGSAMLHLFLEEFVAQLDPQNSGLLLIHAINPWGMKNYQRYNAQHVDLNRNFLPNDEYNPSFNPEYKMLSSLFCPKRPINSYPAETLFFTANLFTSLIRHGATVIRNSALMGQFMDSHGINYGGQNRQEETQVMLDLFQKAFEEYPHITHLDMHSGYGPRNQMSIVLSPLTQESSANLARKLNYPRVVKSNNEEFYPIQGDMIDFEYHLQSSTFPQNHLFAAAFEFGTFGDSLLAAIRSLRAEVMHNQLSNWGAKNEHIAARVNQEFRQLFYPTEMDWQTKALADCRLAFNGVLSAFGLRKNS
ncbi:MAG: M14 family metallopeptidase, partial [Anaerolineales bacterium]